MPKHMTAADILVELGRRIRTAKEAAGKRRGRRITLEELGVNLGRDGTMPRQNVSRIVGGASCSVDSLLSISEALDVDPADLLEGLALGPEEGPDLLTMSVGQLAALARALKTTPSELLRRARGERNVRKR